MIVTAANRELKGGGGVDGAVHKAAGPQLLESLKGFERCETGNAVITDAFNLNAKYVIHAVGPIYKDGNHGEAGLLSSAYKRSIQLAKSVSAGSILFPAISTGVYCYPLEKAARIAVDSILSAVTEFSFDGEVTIVCFDIETKSVFDALD